MGLMGFKTTFSWNGNTSQSRCCTTLVWYVKNLHSVYIHLGIWKPLCWCSCCCGGVGKPLCTKRFMISSNYCKDWTVTLWQKCLEWNNADLGTRPACSWKCRPARRVIPQHLFICKQTLRTYHSGESSSSVVDPGLNNVHGGCVGRSSQLSTTHDTPHGSLSHLLLPKAAWKS